MSGTSIDRGSTRRRTPIRSIGRYRVRIVVVVIVATMAGYLASELVAPAYTASASIVPTDADALRDAPADVERRARQEASRLMSPPVLSAVAEQLGTDVSADDLAAHVSVRFDGAGGLLVVSATAADPAEAAEVANVVASYEQVSRAAAAAQLEAAQVVLQERSAELSAEIADLEAAAGRDPGARRQLQQLNGQLEALQTRSGQFAADAALFAAGADEVAPAVPPGEPSSPLPLRNALLAGAVALVLASLVAYMRAVAVERGSDRAAVLGAPMLARIPYLGRPGGEEHRSPLFDIHAVEAFQFLLAAFEHAVAQVHARSVLVTSASPGEGKSLTAVHLARALAIQGRDVVLVDADIRAHGLTSMLNAEQDPGLVALAEGGDLGKVTRRYRISDAVQLPVVPAGDPGAKPTGLLATGRYREAIDKITATTEVTIIDAGPMLTVADPSALAMQVSAILLVVDADTTEDELRAVAQRLRLVATPLIGYVLNRVRDGGSEWDAYPYAYGSPHAGGATSRRTDDARSADADAAVDDV